MSTETTKILISNLRDINLESKIDLFIGFISFESRSLSIPTHLNFSNIPDNIFYINKPSVIDQDLKSYNQLILKKHISSLNIIMLDKSDPLTNMKTISNSLIPHSNKKNFCVDITTFNHETLLIMLRLLILLKKENLINIQVLYNPAYEYAPKIQNYADKWLSKGIKEIRSVLGFPGSFSPLKSFHLLILAGMEYERTSKLVEEFEPSQLSLGFPVEKGSAAFEAYSANLSKYKEMFSIYNKDKIHFFNFSAYNPILTKEMIFNHLKDFKDYNNVISPMNNKLSTLGVGLLALENKDLQICYPIPNIYNLDYSTPSNDIYSFNL